MYIDTVTIFTRSGNEWYPTLVAGADFNANRAAILARYGENSKDRSELHLRINSGNVAGKPFLQPKVWQALSAAEKTQSLSMQEGDFFILGDFTSLAYQGTVSDNVYAEGFYQYMNHSYDDVYLITSVARYSVIPHIEVMGK